MACAARRRATEALAIGVGRAPDLAPAQPVIEGDNPDTLANVPTFGDANRERIIAWLRGRTSGKTQDEVAKSLGISTHALRYSLQKAAKEGWLQFLDPEERLKQVLSHRAVDALEQLLSKPSEKSVLETLKGLGLFKNYQAIKVESDTPPTVLALKVEVTGDPQATTTVAGQILGTPRVLTITNPDLESDNPEIVTHEKSE